MIVLALLNFMDMTVFNSYRFFQHCVYTRRARACAGPCPPPNGPIGPCWYYCAFRQYPLIICILFLVIKRVVCLPLLLNGHWPIKQAQLRFTQS